MAGTSELFEWERAYFRRFVDVCLGDEQVVAAQLDCVSVTKREDSPESGIYLDVEVDRTGAEPFHRSTPGPYPDGPFTLYADDEDGPFIEVLFWLDSGYLASFESWKQTTKPGQANRILRVPEASALRDKAE